MPAPTLSAPENTDRNIAKFSETCRTPRSGAASTRAATMASLTPLGAAGDRRMRSRESPRVPHGTKDCTAQIAPSLARTMTATQRPSARSPRRLSAIEKPRSGSSPRHCSARRTISSRVLAGRSACRSTVMSQSAARTRAPARLTGRMARPSRVNRSTSTTASSPRLRARRPAATYAVAPCSDADRTPGCQACSRACSSQALIALGQSSLGPMGSPEARHTGPTTR